MKRPSTKKLTTEQFIYKANKKHCCKYDYSKSKYYNQKSRVIITCPAHGDFTQVANYHLSGNGCQKCAGETISSKLKYTTEEFIKMATTIHKDKYDYSNTRYTNNKEKVNIICHKHGEFFQYSSHHLAGNGCDKCAREYTAGTHLYNTDKFISLSNAVHNNKYDYSMVNYHNSQSKVKIICREHGMFSQMPAMHLEGQGCPDCVDLNFSKGEKRIKKFLEINNIKFERQKKFNLCKNKRCLPFDFYLTDFNICIEYNGKLHYEIVDFFGGKEAFKQREINDKIKTLFCKNHNINLVVIKYSESIEKRLTDMLHILNNHTLQLSSVKF